MQRRRAAKNAENLSKLLAAFLASWRFHSGNRFFGIFPMEAASGLSPIPRDAKLDDRHVRGAADRMTQPRFDSALLINPPTGLYRRDDRCQSKVEDQTVNIVFPPIELASIAAVLRRAGVRVSIGDYPARASLDDYVADLRAFKPVGARQRHDRDYRRRRAGGVDRQGNARPGVLTLAKGECLDAPASTCSAPTRRATFASRRNRNRCRTASAGAPIETLPGLVWRRPEHAGAAPKSSATRATARRGPERDPRAPRNLLDNALYVAGTGAL